MRLPAVNPQKLTPQQHELYVDMRRGLEVILKEVASLMKEGDLPGPCIAWLAFPSFGAPAWTMAKSMFRAPRLPAPVREIALLVTGAKFHAAYGLFAHVMVGESRGLPDEKMATIVAGHRPNNLTHQEGVAYDVASALVAGGVLPELVYRQAVAWFGKDGAAELITLVGLYSLICITVNGFDVPVPELVTGYGSEPE